MSMQPVSGPEAGQPIGTHVETSSDSPTKATAPPGPPLLHRVRDFILGYPQRPDVPEGPTGETVPGGPGDPVTPPGAPGPGESVPTHPVPVPTDPEPLPGDPLPGPTEPSPQTRWSGPAVPS